MKLSTFAVLSLVVLGQGENREPVTETKKEV